MMSLRNKALQKYKKTKRPEHWEYYKQIKNFTNTAIKNGKKAYLQFKINSNNYKTFWRDLKDLNIYSKSTNIEIPDELCDVEHINSYFANSSLNPDEPDLETLNFYKNNIRSRVDTFNFNLCTIRHIEHSTFHQN